MANKMTMPRTIRLMGEIPIGTAVCYRWNDVRIYGALTTDHWGHILQIYYIEFDGPIEHSPSKRILGREIWYLEDRDVEHITILE